MGFETKPSSTDNEIAIKDISSFNDVPHDGYWRNTDLTIATGGAPHNAEFVILQTTSDSGSKTVQEVVGSHNSGVKWQRLKTTGDWGAWQEFRDRTWCEARYNRRALYRTVMAKTVGINITLDPVSPTTFGILEVQISSAGLLSLYHKESSYTGKLIANLGSKSNTVNTSEVAYSPLYQSTIELEYSNARKVIKSSIADLDVKDVQVELIFYGRNSINQYSRFIVSVFRAFDYGSSADIIVSVDRVS